ncbi:glycosyltransferase family 2 protein [Paenibacillus sp. J2TS4]|uniref:glycosyltransferase family 2 protein n=1 Tax=Paenibacillus sp. J2TS4 TaxID=2807194 RepID=UPI001B0985E4|nr:glycosyltransferase family 2 protein [Paenibacillus sp. J2TS4]GIP31294.1 glycosyl transferase [Paenibacillus sp. J2TS4]
MLTSIIIPTYKGLHLLQDCVQSIRQFTEEPYEIIVVDNASGDGTLEYCVQQGIDFVSLPSNRGFPVACNYGMKLARGDCVLLLNNDIVVSHHWLANLLNCLTSQPDRGIVGPMTNYVSGKQQSDLQYEDLSQFHHLTETVNRPDPAKWQEVERLVGFCFAFKRELMDRIGWLDERFSPGHYEDDDYCYRARQAGYKLAIAGDTHVHHHGSASFKQHAPEQLLQLPETNYYKFMEKWGVDPRQFI